MSIRSRVTQAISNWFHGIYIPYNNPPGAGVFIVGGYYERHWTAKVVGTVVGFYLLHWKWLWTTALALLGLSISAHWFK